MSLVAKLGFLGAGRMATALAKGFIDAGLMRPGEVLASDSDPQARARFAEATGATIVNGNREAAICPTLIVAVKPAQVPELLQEIHDDVGSRHLLLSIAAGVPLSLLEKMLPSGVRIVRVMPNTPAMVGASATAFSLGAHCTEDDAIQVDTLFRSVGLAVVVKEPLLDAVTGLSGSGPAYGYLMIEALSDGAVAEGLPRETATRLAAQTLLGAARMVLETGRHPGVLKDEVTSPGGTTIEGLQALENLGLRGGLMRAVRAAAAKSRSLANQPR